MTEISKLKPQKVFEIFEMLSSVPHGSGNTKQISDLIFKFAKEYQLEVYQDEVNDIVIKKPATKGYENHPTVLLQGHMDMVAVKKPEKEIDMAKEGLSLVTDGEYLWADGTSLGGDDCMGASVAMAILTDETISHPALEALFTVDEETCMLGAHTVDPKLLTGRTMINLDSENEGVFTVSCAGGVRVDIALPINSKQIPDNYRLFELEISGLTGGHSGIEINKQRANAIVQMGVLLNGIFSTVGGLLISISGGEFSNVIPKKAKAVIAIPEDSEYDLRDAVKEFYGAFKISSFGVSDPGVKVTCYDCEGGKIAIDEKTSKAVSRLLSGLPNGVYKWSEKIENFVDISSNIGVIEVSPNGFLGKISARAAKKEERDEIVSVISKYASKYDASVSLHDEYPGWAYAEKSRVRDVAVDCYKKLTGKEPIVEGVHAGLECGIFADKLPGLDAVSMGPNLSDIHSVNEKVEVKSVENLYNLVVEMLKNL